MLGTFERSRAFISCTNLMGFFSREEEWTQYHSHSILQLELNSCRILLILVNLYVHVFLLILQASRYVIHYETIHGMALGVSLIMVINRAIPKIIPCEVHTDFQSGSSLHPFMSPQSWQRLRHGTEAPRDCEGSAGRESPTTKGSGTQSFTGHCLHWAWRRPPARTVISWATLCHTHIYSIYVPDTYLYSKCFIIKIVNTYGSRVCFYVRARVSTPCLLAFDRYKRAAEKLYNFKYRSDDIVVTTYPKSGTLWTMELVWAMTHLDQFQLPQKKHTNERVFVIDDVGAMSCWRVCVLGLVYVWVWGFFFPR